VADNLLSGTPFNSSDNGWDWLGSGVYFWEANPKRGLEFAHLLARWRKGKAHEITDPYVVGAVIELGFCLDLMSSTGIQTVASVHQDFLAYCKEANVDPPKNEGGEDSVFRKLDCAVINHLHKIREAGKFSPFDTVRGVFIEGGPIYPGAGLYESTHIQICVRNLACIKGVFRVPDDQLR
jgi:hypothetical protein